MRTDDRDSEEKEGNRERRAGETLRKKEVRREGRTGRSGERRGKWGGEKTKIRGQKEMEKQRGFKNQRKGEKSKGKTLREEPDSKRGESGSIKDLPCTSPPPHTHTHRLLRSVLFCVFSEKILGAAFPEAPPVS